MCGSSALPVKYFGHAHEIDRNWFNMLLNFLFRLMLINIVTSHAGEPVAFRSQMPESCFPLMMVIISV